MLGDPIAQSVGGIKHPASVVAVAYLCQRLVDRPFAAIVRVPLQPRP